MKSKILFFIQSLILFGVCAASSLPVPYYNGDQIALDGIRYRVHYRVDGDAVSSIYIFPNNELTRDWVIRRDHVEGRYFLLSLDELDADFGLGVLFFSEDGKLRVLVENIPDCIKGLMRSRDRITSYVSKIIERSIGPSEDGRKGPSNYL